MISCKQVASFYYLFFQKQKKKKKIYEGQIAKRKKTLQREEVAHRFGGL
jgi:hypothetical protein